MKRCVVGQALTNYTRQQHYIYIYRNLMYKRRARTTGTPMAHLQKEASCLPQGNYDPRPLPYSVNLSAQAGKQVQSVRKLAKIRNLYYLSRAALRAHNNKEARGH